MTQQVLNSTGAAKATGAGSSEVAYAEKTTDTSITGTSAAGSTTIVTAPAFTADGTSTYMVHVQFRGCNRGTSYLRSTLFLDGTYVQDLHENPSTTQVPLSLASRVTPAAGSRTYSLRAYVDAGTGTINATGFGPTSIRVVKV